jgi:hypothetical protein
VVVTVWWPGGLRLLPEGNTEGPQEREKPRVLAGEAG